MPRTAKKQEEYQAEIVSGGASFASTLALGTNINLGNEINADVRRLMRRDSEIESSLEFLIDTIFAEGVTPRSPVTDEDAEDFEQAREISEFVSAATANPDRSVEAVMREMFRAAFFAGAKVAEIVLKADENDRLILHRINPKPLEATAFACDKFYNVLGLVGAKNGGRRAFSYSALSVSADEIIDREKFVVVQFELEDNDPRGVVKATPVYDAWCDKRGTRAQWKEWRRTSAIPKKVGKLQPNAKPRQVFDANNQPVIENGVAKTI